jgi:hypothetical protein
MFDHKFIGERGGLIPVSEMTDEDIAYCLSSGFTVYSGDAMNTAHESVAERLRIEQLIRMLGLR